MFTGCLTAKEVDELVNLLHQTQELEPAFLRHESLLNSITLTWFQCMCIEHTLISKGTLVSLGTGLGKTATSAGYVEHLLRENPGKKALFFCLPESIDQIYDDYSSYLKRKIITTTGESAQVQSLSWMKSSDWDIAIISYQATYLNELANWFIRNQSDIICAVLDEVHELSQDSILNSNISAYVRNIPSKMFLSATPITVSPAQVITLMNMLDGQMIPTGKNLLKPYEIRDPETFEVVDYKRLDDLGNSFYPRYVSWTRKELGLQGNYTPHLMLIKPTEEQLNCSLNEIETVIKGQKNSNQTKVLKTVVSDLVNDGKTGLIYCDTRANSNMLCELLRENGIRAFIANGEEEHKRIRGAVLKLFKQKEIDVVITNLTTSLNLDCDYLIFWENTNRAVQMLGRCERGFLKKNLDIYFLLTEGTVEVAQFSKNVYRRCKWLGEALAKDVETFSKVQNALEKLSKGEV